MYLFYSFLFILIFSFFIFIFHNFQKLKININSHLLDINNEQSLIKEEVFNLKKNFFNQMNNEKIINDKNQKNLKKLNDLLNKTLFELFSFKNEIFKNETNIKNEIFQFLKNKEQEKLIHGIKKNLNEYYYPLISNYSLNKFKSLSLKYNTQEDFSYKNNPILSIVIPIYNCENKLLNGLLSIEVQNQKNIEIIFVDDFSNDNSTFLIKEVQKIDKRIVLYENKENKGILYTRCYGINKARGKYILSFDQDDLYVNKNLFNILLNIAEENDLDILNFEFSYLKNKNVYLQTKFKKPIYNKIINNSELRNIKNVLTRQDYSFFTWDKLIKRNVYIKALNLMKNEYLKVYMNQGEDICISLCLFKIANNFMKISQFGYLYIQSEFQCTEIIKNYHKEKNLNLIEKYINSFFESEKLLYNITNETKEEKTYVIERLIGFIDTDKFIKKLQNKYTKNLILEVCNIFIKSKFTNKNYKTIIIQFVKKFREINKLK